MRIEDDILRTARSSPQRPAIETDSRVVTFGELAATSARWAGRIRDAGLEVGEPCWVCMANSPEFIVVVLAIVRAGGVAVPVNPRYTDSELRHLAGSCSPAAACCDTKVYDRIRSALASNGTMRFVATVDAGAGDIMMESVGCGSAVERRPIITQDGVPGIVYFTSGSTGYPKAILLTHANVASNARATARAFGLCSEDRGIVCMQMCHSYTLTKQMLAHLGVGATLVLAPDFFLPAVVLDVMARKQVTTLFAVPSMHTMLYEYLGRHSMQIPSLRMLVTGGSPMPSRVQLGWCNDFPGVSFYSSYGLSEASPCVTSLRPEWAVSKVGSIGQPIPGVEVTIVGDDDMPVSLGDAGELCVRGPNVMAGYLNDPAATGAALRGGWLHTGDLAWQDRDGCIYLCGRRDDMILRGGENVYPAEIENVLCSHPAILEAAVIGVPHLVLGQDVVAYVTLRETGRYDPQSIRRHCCENLALFKVPREVRAVEALSRTANGKISRAALRNAEASKCAEGKLLPNQELA